MSGTVIAVPTNFMSQVQAIVNGFVQTIQQWFPDLLLISLIVWVTIFAINWVSRKVKSAWHGR